MNYHQKCKQGLKEILEIVNKYDLDFLVFDQSKKSLKLIESVCVNDDYIQLNTVLDNEED